MAPPADEAVPVVTITATPEVEGEAAPMGGRLTARLAAARREDDTFNSSTNSSALGLPGQSTENSGIGAVVTVGPSQGSSLGPASKEHVRNPSPPSQEKQPPTQKKLSIRKQFWLLVARVRMAMDTPLGRRLVTFFSRCLMALDTVRGFGHIFASGIDVLINFAQWRLMKG